jgi:hypothetical protein
MGPYRLTHVFSHGPGLSHVFSLDSSYISHVWSPISAPYLDLLYSDILSLLLLLI